MFFTTGCVFYRVGDWDDLQIDLHVSLHVGFKIQFAGIVPVFTFQWDPFTQLRFRVRLLVQINPINSVEPSWRIATLASESKAGIVLSSQHYLPHDEQSIVGMRPKTSHLPPNTFHKFSKRLTEFSGTRPMQRKPWLSLAVFNTVNWLSALVLSQLSG